MKNLSDMTQALMLTDEVTFYHWLISFIFTTVQILGKMSNYLVPHLLYVMAAGVQWKTPSKDQVNVNKKKT